MGREYTNTGIVLDNNSGTTTVNPSAGTGQYMAIYDSSGTQTIAINGEDGELQSELVNVKPFDNSASGALRVYAGTAEASLIFEVDSVARIGLGVDTFVENGIPFTIEGTVAQGNPSTHQATLFVDDSGAGGKHELRVIFGSGDSVLLATEP